MVMGWHSVRPELRYLYGLRDLDSVRKGDFSRVTAITPEITLHFGEDPRQPRIWNLDKEILWWLYENDCIDSVPKLGFEISCHGNPIIARLLYPKVDYVLKNLGPEDRITSIQIVPPACF